MNEKDSIAKTEDTKTEERSPEEKSDLTVSLSSVHKKIGKELTEEKFEKQQQTLLVLEKTSQFLAAETDVTVLLGRIAETFAKSLGAKYMNFWNFTPDKKGAFIIANYGMIKEYADSFRKKPLQVGTGWVGKAMDDGKTWATSDILKDPETIRNLKTWLPTIEKQGYHGILCMPLKKDKEIIGGMCIYYEDVHEFDHFEMNLSTIVANQAATALSNATLFGDLTTEKNKTFSVIQSLNDGLIMYDLEGSVTFFNPKAQEYLLLEEQDVVGKKISGETGKTDIYWKNLLAINKLLTEDYEVKEYTTEGPHRLVLQIIHSPVHDEEKKKIGYMQILRDITKEKEIELIKDNFVTTASHQLRTPITGIRWSLNTLKKEAPEGLDASQKEMISKAAEASDYVVNLLNDLLDTSHIEEGKFGYNFIKKDIYTIAEKVFKDLELNAQKAKVDLVLKKPKKDLPKVNIDSEKLYIAISNVVDNAIKYTPDGTVTISFLVDEDRKTVSLSVKDSGIGIPLDSQKFIFLKFFRAKNAVRVKTDGSGLGLYIAKSITDKHNAMLSFTSSEDSGTEFLFTFSLKEKDMPVGLVEDSQKEK